MLPKHSKRKTAMDFASICQKGEAQTALEITKSNAKPTGRKNFTLIYHGRTRQSQRTALHRHNQRDQSVSYRKQRTGEK